MKPKSASQAQKSRAVGFAAASLHNRTKPRRYRVLKDGPYSLFAAYDRQIPATAIVTEVQFSQNGETRFGFECFDNVTKLFEHVRSLPPDKRHYFEWILENRARKPYFDIDLSCSLEERERFESEINGFFESFMDALVLLGEEYDVDFDLERDVLIFESNGPKGDLYKFSYHIIINNWCVKDAAQSMEFARHIQLYMAQNGAREWSERLDMGVYSNGRAFRLFMSSKLGTNRILAFLDNWKCGDRVVESVYSRMDVSFVEKTRRVFSASIITLTTNCEEFPAFDLPEKRSFSAEDVDDEDAHAALEMFEADPDTNSPVFEYNSTKGSFLILKRRSPGFCSFCTSLSGKTQVHEAENAYISIFDRNVYFVCRRSLDYSPERKPHHHLLGVLEPLEDSEDASGGEHAGAGENTPAKEDTPDSGRAAEEAEKEDGLEGGHAAEDQYISGRGAEHPSTEDTRRVVPAVPSGAVPDGKPGRRDNTSRLREGGPGGGLAGTRKHPSVTTQRPFGCASREVSFKKPTSDAESLQKALSDRNTPKDSEFLKTFPHTEKKQISRDLEAFFSSTPHTALYASSIRR